MHRESRADFVSVDWLVLGLGVLGRCYCMPLGSWTMLIQISEIAASRCHAHNLHFEVQLAVLAVFAE